MTHGKQYKQVYGNQQVAAANPVAFGSGPSIANPFQLVTWKSEDGVGRRMLVTLNQIIKAGRVAPWQDPGSVGFLTFPPNAGVPQVRIQWGIGGARQQALIAYPLSGGTFPLTADSLEIDIVHRGQIAPGEPIQFAASILLGDAPSFGEPKSSALTVNVAATGGTIYQLRGSFCRSIVVEYDKVSTDPNFPADVTFAQYRVDNSGTLASLIKNTQIVGGLKANGQIEVMLDPWAAGFEFFNNDATHAASLYVTEVYAFA